LDCILSTTPSTINVADRKFLEHLQNKKKERQKHVGD
jgi:hypothetical protein